MEFRSNEISCLFGSFLFYDNLAVVNYGLTIKQKDIKVNKIPAVKISTEIDNIFRFYVI